MKKIVLILSSLIFSFNLFCQEKETITQNRADYVGVKTKSFFMQQPHVNWFEKSQNTYELDKKTIKKLKKYTEGITIKVFMSVWCHDSKREVPHLYKILDSIGFDKKSLEVVALDRSKKTPDNLQEGFNIIRTPTLIFYKKGKEIGRYVELPRETLEKDILRIINGKSYKHSYDKS